MFYWGDFTYILLIPGLILAFYAQSKVKSTFAKFSRVSTSRGLSGAQVARALLDDGGLQDVAIEQVGGRLSDHYDPRVKKLRLSSEVYHGTSVASVGVAAHETGHALQHANHYVPLGLRNAIVPVAQLGSTAAFPLFFIGLLMSNGFFMNLGIIFFIGALVFQLVTLPVEFNASRRAVYLLEKRHFLTSGELDGAKSVLSAAALTYVAAAAMAALQLVRLLILRGNRD